MIIVGEVQKIVEGALVLHAQGRLSEAFDIYDRLLARLPNGDPNLLHGYGLLLAQQGHYGLALRLLKEAVDLVEALPPGTPNEYAGPLFVNYGMALRSVERYKEAEHAYLKAAELCPNDPVCLTGAAGAFINRNASAKVLEYARRAVEIDPEYAEGHLHLALGLLEQGKFDEAWPHYEYRWKTPRQLNDVRPYKAPRWHGEKVRTLAIHGEQGLGDEIMFMSCFREARKRADRIIIECAPRLVELFERSFGTPCYPDHEALISAVGEPDAYIPMGSLPSVIGLPLDGHAYLKRAELKPNPRPLIGLSWCGGTDKTNHSLRSIPLTKWAPILCLRNADFISLQYGGDDVDEEAQLCDVATLPDREFTTIADALSRCDLVISVCQTNVHLAGAFGIPCFVLCPEKSAWRYCRDRMEFYDSVTLFKKKEGQSWDNVISRVAIAANMRFADAA